MKRRPLALLLASAAVAAAQPASPPAKDAPAALPVPAPSRAVSSATADLLKAALPKSALVKPPEKKPDAALPDLRETDQPHNGIVRLPRYVVQEPRPPVLTERDLGTNPQGLARIAMRRYFTEADRVLNRFMLPLFATSRYPDLTANESRALDLYYEDERLQNMSEVADRTNMVMRSDSAAGAKLKNEAQQTFMHWSDFGYQGATPK